MNRVIAIGQLAVALGSSRLLTLESRLRDLVPKLIPVNVAYEILLQSYLFFGYAQAIESAKIFAERFPSDESAFQPNELRSETRDDWRHRGELLCSKIYAPNYERLVTNMSQVSPELATWMVEEGYGKVLSRSGPTSLEREIASIIFLAISGHPVQLYSHVRGAKNLGATRAELVSIVAEVELNESQKSMIAGTIEKVFGA